MNEILLSVLCASNVLALANTARGIPAFASIASHSPYNPISSSTCYGGAQPLMRLAPTPAPDPLRTGLKHVIASFLLGATLLSGAPTVAADDTTAGFEEFAAQGGVMKADPSCFFKECGPQTQACFTNPSCLKGITCLGNCRGEQLCATQCFARFGSEKLNNWLGCTLEEKECVSTGVKQDTSAFYSTAPTKLESWQPKELEGKWYKVLGYSQKYDCYPCQTNTFQLAPDGGLDNDILFRVPKPDGSGFWENNFPEHLNVESGPQGKASMVVGGKMFGLGFNEQWYMLGSSDGKGEVPAFQFVAYKGDTQQGPYEGAFVFTREKDVLETSPALLAAVDKVAASNGMQRVGSATVCKIDNSCPANVEQAGVSDAEVSKEKLEWKDVFELTEWFRPGTLKKDEAFDPNKM